MLVKVFYLTLILLCLHCVLTNVRAFNRSQLRVVFYLVEIALYCLSLSWNSSRLGVGMASMSSTLVETVSINYEDFNESFLTCGTCLC